MGTFLLGVGVGAVAMLAAVAVDEWLVTRRGERMLAQRLADRERERARLAAGRRADRW